MAEASSDMEQENKKLFTSTSEDVFQKLLVGKDDLNTRKLQ